MEIELRSGRYGTVEQLCLTQDVRVSTVHKGDGCVVYLYSHTYSSTAVITVRQLAVTPTQPEIAAALVKKGFPKEHALSLSWYAYLGFPTFQRNEFTLDGTTITGLAAAFRQALQAAGSSYVCGDVTRTTACVQLAQGVGCNAAVAIRLMLFAGLDMPDKPYLLKMMAHATKRMLEKHASAWEKIGRLAELQGVCAFWTFLSALENK